MYNGETEIAGHKHQWRRKQRGSPAPSFSFQKENPFSWRPLGFPPTFTSPSPTASPPGTATVPPYPLRSFLRFRHPFPILSQNNHQVLIFPSFLKNKIKFKHRRRKWSSVLLSGTSQFQSTWTCLNAIWGFNNLALSMHLMMLVIAIRG